MITIFYVIKFVIRIALLPFRIIGFVFGINPGKDKNSSNKNSSNKNSSDKKRSKKKEKTYEDGLLDGMILFGDDDPLGKG